MYEKVAMHRIEGSEHRLLPRLAGRLDAQFGTPPGPAARPIGMRERFRFVEEHQIDRARPGLGFQIDETLAAGRNRRFVLAPFEGVARPPEGKPLCRSRCDSQSWCDSQAGEIAGPPRRAISAHRRPSVQPPSWRVSSVRIAAAIAPACGPILACCPGLWRRLRRAEVITFFARLPKALVGIEACPGGHHWARELRSLGHDVRLIPPQYVRPFVKTNKNDAADAEGICEAIVRPNMRFVPIKSVAQQAAMMLHRTRALLLRQRTQLINAVRGHLAEFGLIARRGAHNIQKLTDLVRDTEADKLPDAARAMLVLLLEQIREAQP